MKRWNLVTMEMTDGSVYAIGRHQFEQDYAQFLMETDGISMGHAVERARDTPEDIETWACEQFNESDFRRIGAPVRLPSYEQMLGKAKTPNHPKTRFIQV